MDYKFIILLLVIVGLILFFTRELDNMKCEMSDKLDKIASYVDNSSKNTLLKMQNGFGMCVNKLKTVNGEYIEQVRKMNDYGNQPITNMSNHYTDTDSQGNEMKFPALSDCKMSRTSVKKQQGGESFYLSDDEPKKSKHTSNEFQMVLPSTEDNKKTEHQFILSPDLIDDENNHITTESVSSNSKKRTTKVEVSCKQNNVDNDNENKNEEIKEISFDEIDDDNNVEESDNDVSVENSEHSSNYGSVSFASNKQQKKLISTENESVTSVIQKLNINNLLSKDMYTSDVLKKMARALTIPIYHKDGSVRRQLKKDELYDKIKGHLTKISK